jgi:hypothetical protein
MRAYSLITMGAVYNAGKRNGLNPRGRPVIIHTLHKKGTSIMGCAFAEDMETWKGRFVYCPLRPSSSSYVGMLLNGF